MSSSKRPLLRRLILSIAGLILLAGCAAEAPDRPSFVIFLADDQGWGDLSVHGNTNLATPRIDSLAADGALFENFYVCSVCSPTRAEFLTGRYYARGGVHGTSAGAERLNLDEQTIAETFQAAGYATGAFGKWHNGSQFPYHPNARGFEEYYGFTSGHWGEYFNPVLDHNGETVRGQGYITDDLTNHAIEFIERNRDRPFFCYIPYNTPHSPMQVPDRFFEKFDGVEPAMRNRDPDKESLPMTRAALAMVENIDWNVGRVLEKLDELQLAGSTVVVYFSDNGPNSWRWNGGMKGRKGSIDEGGLRVPFLIRWPGHIPAGKKVPQIAGAVDLLPTLAEMAGIPVVSKKPLDGISITPLLTGDPESWPDRRIFSLRRDKVSVRTQQYRLDGAGQLFEIAADRGQRRDISGEHPEAAAELRQAAQKWGREVIPLIAHDDRPFPVGDARVTVLPARDGIPHGTVKRSNRFPNSSFFQNWTSTEDSITWDVEVARAGNYEVVIGHTCAPGDEGATIELSFLGSSVRGKVLEAYDPPLIGEKDDRVPRIESYVKDFRPLRLGVVALEQGRGLLTLRAPSIPGRRAIDVGSVTLTLQDGDRQ